MSLLAVVLGSLLTAVPPAAQAAAPTQLEALGITHRRGVLAMLERSPAPRDWALRAQLTPTYLALDQHRAPTPEENMANGALLRKAAEAAPGDRLVQWLWANAAADASGCSEPRPCPERRAALARIEPENSAAWLPVLAEADASGDARAVDATLARMASSTGYEDLFAEGAIAWTDVHRRHPLPVTLVAQYAARDGTGVASARTDPELLHYIQGVAVSAAMVLGSFRALQTCDVHKHADASAGRFEHCETIGRTMFSTAPTLIGRQMGRSVLRMSGADSPDIGEQELTLEWLRFQSTRLQQQEDAVFGASLPYFVDLEETRSEIQAMERVLQRGGISATPPPGWKPDWASLLPTKG
jgi:hypothetical protein